MNLQNAIKICVDTFINPIEKFISVPYADQGGRATIGFGNCFYEDGIAVTFNDNPITLERAEQLRDDVLTKFADRLLKLFTKELTDNQFAACLSLIYNIGFSAFQYSQLLSIINNDVNSPKISELWSKWNHVDGKISNGLTIRRTKAG